jgi:hypothetical protein
MNRREHHHPFPDTKKTEKLLQRNGANMINMKNRLLTDFGIPFEALTRHVMMRGRSGTGKSGPSLYSLPQSKKLNKEAGHGTTKSSKRKN